MSPDTTSGITEVENSQGIQNPYLNAASQYINNSTTPLWSSTQQFSPSSVSQYESPYTQQVVNATQAEFNNQNQQQQNQLAGNAVSSGAFGGDRTATAAAQLAGQQQLSQAPTIASLENQGYSQALGEFNTQQSQQLNANEANAWLNSQAGYGMANLGNQAQSSALTGANALLNVGSTEQQQAQSLLNVPYEQYTAAEAYPFQTTSWLSGIASGLGSNSGGTSSTTYPSSSSASQIAGTGLAATGILGETGAFGSNGYLTGSNGLFSNLGSSSSSIGGATSAIDSSTASSADVLANALSARGGRIPHRASGGGFGSLISGAPNQTIGIPSGNSDVPTVSLSFVPSANQNSGTPLILQNYGTTSQTSGGGSSGLSSAESGISTVASIAALAALLARGGNVPRNDNWRPQPEQRRASGGGSGNSFVTLTPGSYSGSPSVPQLTGDLSGGTLNNPNSTSSQYGSIPWSTAGAQGWGAVAENPRVQNYLGEQQSSASFTPPTIYNTSTGSFAPAGSVSPSSANSAAASAANSASTGSSAYPFEVLFGLTGESGGGSEGSGGTSGGEAASSSGSMRRGGGIKRFQDGGSDQDTPELGASAGPMPDPGAGVSAGSGPPTATAVPSTPTSPHMGSSMAPPGNQSPQSMGPPQSSMRPPPNGADSPGHNQDWSKALLYIGANMMAGRSPNAFTNVGEGLTKGLQQYTSEQQKEQQNQALQSYRQQEGQHQQISEQQAAQRLADAAEQQQNAAKRQDRQYDLDKSKFGLSVQEQQFKENQASQEQYTYQPGSQTDPNDPTKQITGVYRIPKKGDAQPEFISGVNLTQKTAPGASANIPSDTLSVLAERVMAGDTSALQGLGYGSAAAANRLAVNNRVTDILRAQGLTGGDLAAKTAEYMGERAGARTAGTREANVSMAVNEAQQFMPLALQASANVQRSQYPTLNSIIQAYDKGTGDENIVRLAVATNSLINAYSRAITPSGIPTEGNQQRARELLDKAWSNGQYAAAVDQLNKEMQAAKLSPTQTQAEQSQRISGRTSAAAPPVTSMQYKAVGPNNQVIYSNDQRTWYKPDGSTYQP